jgi:hypothetical protein
VRSTSSPATPPPRSSTGRRISNGLRNRDELRFWSLYLGGWSPDGPPFVADRFAVMGTFNIDPRAGRGAARGAAGAARPSACCKTPNRRAETGETATADWAEDGPGRLRVDYILPSRTLTVTGSGILWPGEVPLLGVTGETAGVASDHRLIWVDLAF